MDDEKTCAPKEWMEALARSDAELARGERVPASAVHDDIRRALAGMKSELSGTRKRRPATLSHR